MEPRDTGAIERCQGFIEYLRSRDFSIGIDRALRIHRVLDRVGCEIEPSQLASVLAPLVATSPDEQRRFHDAFAAYYAFFRDPEETPAGQTRAKTTEHPTHKRRPALMRSTLSVIAAVLFVLVLGPERKLPDKIDIPIDSIPPVDTTVSGTALAFASLPPLTPSDSPVSPSVRSPWADLAALLWPAAIGLLGGSVAWVVARRRDRRSSTDPTAEANGPYTVPIHSPSEQPNGYAAADFLATSRRVRRRQLAEGMRLLVDQSVTATIEASRFPTLRYERATRPPEYLFLIARASVGDHQARLFDDLARGFLAQGVFVTRYFYEGDPSVCYAAPDRFTERDPRLLGEAASRPGVPLSTLQRMHVGQRLLVCSDGSELVDALRGDLTPTAKQLTEWAERAVLTPAAFEGWGVRERTLDVQFVVRPATLAGLRSAVERFDAIVPADVRDLVRMGARSAVELPPTEERRIGEVQRYLGEPAFRWVCACALYPELHWDLTLALGKLTELGPDTFTEEALLHIVRLPWFRQGWIPDDVRGALTSYLASTDPRLEVAARNCIVKLVQRNLAPEGSVARRRQDVVLLAQRVALAGDDETKRSDALRDARTVDRAELLEDAAAVSALQSAQPSPLPAWLSSRVYRNGIRALGVVPGVKTLLTLILVAILAVVGWMMRPARPDPAPVGDVAQLVPTIQRTELWPNDTMRIAVTAFDSASRVVSTSPIVWSAANTSIATVDSTGLVRAGSPAVSDSTEVLVTAGGRLARTRVVVNVPPAGAPGVVLAIGTPRAATVGDSIQIPQGARVVAETLDDTTCARPVLRTLAGNRAQAATAGRVTLAIASRLPGGRSSRREESVTVRSATRAVSSRAVATPAVAPCAVPVVTRLDSIFRGLINRGVRSIRVGEQLNLPRQLGVSSALLASERVTFTSEAPRIASVQTNGTVTGVSPGQTRIVMRRDTLTASFGVRVNEQRPLATPVDRGTRTVAVGDTITLDAAAPNSPVQGYVAPQTIRSLNSGIARVVGSSRVVGVSVGTTRVVNSDSANPVFWGINVVRDTTPIAPPAAATAAVNALLGLWKLTPARSRVEILRLLSSVRPNVYGFVAIGQLPSSGAAAKQAPTSIELFPTRRDASHIMVLNRQEVVQVLGFASRDEISRAASEGSITLRTVPSASDYCPVVLPVSGVEFNAQAKADATGGTVLAVFSGTKSRPTVPTQLRQTGWNPRDCLPVAAR